MTIDEYVQKAKDELDEFADLWQEEHRADPNNWPLDFSEEEWAEQELAHRFN